MGWNGDIHYRIKQQNVTLWGSQTNVGQESSCSLYNKAHFKETQYLDFLEVPIVRTLSI